MAFFKIIFLIFYLIFFIMFPDAAKTATYEASNLFFKLIMPSFIPMYLISNLLLNYPSIFKVFRKLFFFMSFKSDDACGIFLIGLLSGNPTTAILIKRNFLNNRISQSEASQLILFSGMMSPLFIIMSGRLIGFNTFEVGSVILSIILSSMIIGSILLRKSEKDFFVNNTKRSNPNFFLILDDAPKILLNILLVIITIMLIKTPFNLFQDKIPLFIKILIDTLEVTTGVSDLKSFSINPFSKLLIFTFLICFSGIAIIIESIYGVLKLKKEQTFDNGNQIICSNLNFLSINKFVIFRLILAVLATFICFVINCFKFFF